MKIFLTGGSGTLGQYLNLELSKKHDLLTQYNYNIGNCSGFKNVKLSLLDFKLLKEIFVSFQPDIVIHTASVSTTEKADKLSPQVVYDINVNVTAKLAELCAKQNCKLVYTSTDLVYAGYRGSMLKEDAKLIPVSLYAETKLMGEVKIQRVLSNYLILRMALMFGFGLNHSRNHFQFVYDELKSKRAVKLFTDQFRTPLALHDAALMISELIEKNVSGEILNFGGNERISRYGLAEILCDEAGFDKKLLQKSTMEEANISYKVADVSMNCDKLKSFGIVSTELRESIRQIVKNKTK